jgi:hypothetical protein
LVESRRVRVGEAVQAGRAEDRCIIAAALDRECDETLRLEVMHVLFGLGASDGGELHPQRL